MCGMECYGFIGLVCFFVKQKTAYEMRISDWSSDVCSSDLAAGPTRTALLMTTVPVRALTMTRAGGSAETTLRFSISLISIVRTSAPCGAAIATETASTASARPLPRRELIAEQGRASCRERVGPYV